MKKLLLSLSCLLISLCVYCQDIIVKKNTDELQVKILEVGINEIKYKNWNNQEGPTYVINKSDIFMIKYANGDKEWRYLFIPAGQIRPNSSFALLAERYGEL